MEGHVPARSGRRLARGEPDREDHAMRRFTILGAALVLALALAVPAAAADPVRPFRGSGTGVDSMGAPVDCPAWAGWRYESDGTMYLAHLGRASFHVSHCSAMTDGPRGTFGAGTITFTAANGDTLVISDWGTFDLTLGSGGAPERSDIVLDFEVVGGTGRFAGAEGSGHGDGYSVLASGMTTMTLWGAISY
jgi:hypothetical protein